MAFSDLLFKIVPFYFLIFLGYLGGKLFNPHRDTVTKILFFLITPFVFFAGVVNTKLDASIIALPFLTYLISTTFCLLFYFSSTRIWQDSTKNLMAMSSGGGNTGYFGLPIALLFLDEQGVGVYILAMLGMTLYENSLGYYILAKGSHTARECVIKVLKVPALYAVIGGLIVNWLQIRLPEFFFDAITHMKGTYTVLGMMIIGLGLASLPNFKFDFKFIGMTFLAKFAAWPLMILLLITLDETWFHFFNTSVYNALILLSIVPIGTNTVIFASLLKNKPEKAVISVMLSMLFALGYIPLMTSHFMRTEIAHSIDQEPLADTGKEEAAAEINAQ